MQQRIAVPSDAGALAATLHLPERLPAPVVVCSHGLLSSRESSKYVAIGEELSRGGVAVVRFDFSGCGESETELGESLLATRLRDLDAVLDYVTEQPWAGGAVSLLGSSFGGYVSLLAAASGRHAIRRVVCWATPFDLSRASLALEDLEHLKRIFPPGYQLGFPMNLDGLAPVSGVLILHGQKDEIVPWKDAVEIYRRVREPKRIVLLESVDHRFLDPESRRLAVRLSCEWFRGNESPG